MLGSLVSAMMQLGKNPMTITLVICHNTLMYLLCHIESQKPILELKIKQCQEMFPGTVNLSHMLL